jgi:hypothetical protein
MAFIRSKTVKGHRYYQVVENYRDKDSNGKHRQRVIHHLGKHRSLKRKLQFLERKKAEENRIASSRYDGASSMIRSLGENIVKNREGLRSYRPEDPVAILMEKAISHLPPGGSMRVSEWHEVFRSVGEQIGLFPSEVEKRWRYDKEVHKEKRRQRVMLAGEKNMLGLEETRSKYQEFMKKVEGWERKRVNNLLSEKQSSEIEKQLSYEWSQELYIPVGYHEALIVAKEHEERASSYQAQIDEILEVQRNYF